MRQTFFPLQQPIEKLSHPDYNVILNIIENSPDLVPNSEAKEIVKPKGAHPNTKDKKQRKESKATGRKDIQQSGASVEV